MKSNLLTNILLLLIIVLLVILNFIPSNSPKRYSVYFPNSFPVKTGCIYKIDHHTGQMWILNAYPQNPEDWKPWKEYEIGGHKIPLHLLESDSSELKQDFSEFYETEP